ncbi:MAG TPA: hypothetical protein VN017_03190 [Pseudoxanthomonas sp.]|nr:hypothetical protein [Pseudoxanthomonas sp.]
MPITPNYAFEKRQRELAKKRKQEEKKAQKRDAHVPASPEPAAIPGNGPTVLPAPPVEQTAATPKIHRKRGP